MITTKERAYLRKLANTVPALYQIGKGGVTDAVIAQLSEALDANELIKVKVLENAGIELRECANIASDALMAEQVQCIGKVFVLYRQAKDPDKRKIKL